MTHTMHRRGDGEDYVIHVRAPGSMKDGSAPRFRAVLGAVKQFSPVLAGTPSLGNSRVRGWDELAAAYTDGLPLHLTFADEASFLGALESIRQLDTGFSVSVSAPCSTVHTLENNQAFHPAGIQMDLGSYGPAHDTDFPSWVLDILSLCGHLRINPHLVLDEARRMEKKGTNALQAAEKLGRVCRCGAFNIALAASLLEAHVSTTVKGDAS